MAKHIDTIQSAVASSGAKLAHFKCNDGTELWLPRNVLSFPQPKLLRRLQAEGLIVHGKQERDCLAQCLSEITPYHGPAPIDRSGWNGPNFVMPDRCVFSAASTPSGPVIFSPRFPQPSFRCSAEEWRANVGELLTGQSVLMFVAMAVLAPPLLDIIGQTEDLLFELIAPSRSDQSLLAQIVFSVNGVVSSHGVPGVIPFDRLLADPNRYRDEHADLLLLANDVELSMAADGAARRGANLRSFLSAPAGTTQRKAQLTLLLGSRSLAELVGEETEIGQEVRKRSISIALGGERPLGIFNRLPDDAASASELAQRLTTNSRLYYGRVVGQFIRKLVDERTSHPLALKAEIDEDIERFFDHAKVDRNDLTATNIARSFAIVYSAGRLARSWKILPSAWNCGPAALACYFMRRAGQPAWPSFTDLLQKLAADRSAVHLGDGYDEPSNDAVAAAEVFVRHSANVRQLMIRTNAIAGKIPYWQTRRTTPEVINTMIRDVDNPSPKRRLPHEGQVRMFVFQL
ncbi:DUF927 domain-containing protein [Sphingomonas sp. Ag1]|uniref:DUF927 domain-containing protein n=1 Tax=Sphingomonas sp. Ag1 TaxID=1642949 RepID=UPI0009E27E50|nr:DUF927 domain-containing protein [Sphingomonas sp. Ag1]